MTDVITFSSEINQLLLEKQEWYNTKHLPSVLEKVRLIYTCTKNLYDLLVSKSLIVPDPYRMDKKIADISSPDKSMFNDSEAAMVIGTRFSEYENMLDYICTYYRFSVENLDMVNIKKLIDFLNSFPWSDFSATSLKPNIRGLARLLNQAKINATQITISMISDSVEKCAKNVEEVCKELNILGRFQREAYKIRLRQDIFNHPNFDKETAFSSQESELAEIKKLFPLVMGKTPFYSELVNEIIMEDLGPDAEKLRENLKKTLRTEEAVVTAAKSKSNHLNLLMASIEALGAAGTIYTTINSKVRFNFDLIKREPETFGEKLGAMLRKLFKLKSKEPEYVMSISDPLTHQRSKRIFKVSEIQRELSDKMFLYNDIAKHGKHYNEITSLKPEAIVTYMNKEISSCRKSYNTLVALDDFFKSEVPNKNQLKIKGFKLELDTLRNAIISSNAKKAEYQELVEEEQQLKKLGLSND